MRLAPLKDFLNGADLIFIQESLVSSNLNSNLLSFHCAHPKGVSF